MINYTEMFEYISRRIDGKPGTVHAVGVCGVGMAGLAAMLARIGWKVSGCDGHPGNLSGWLEKNGVSVSTGHDPSHVASLNPDTDFVLVTPAVADDNPEIAAARAAGLHVIRRGVALAALMSRHPQSVAICGSHGKTTTSTITALLLKKAGLQPGWCIGGVSSGLPGTSSVPDDCESNPFVAESDESDGTLALYSPYITVVTSVDFDHMEHFSDEAEFESVFSAVAFKTRGKVVCAWDDSRVRKVLGDVPGLITTGLAEDSHIRAGNINADISGTEFTLYIGGVEAGVFRLGVPGTHNLKNALCSLGAVAAMGLDAAKAAEFLSQITALPARRFEIVSRTGGITLVSDYAHHPSEIAALVRMARERNPERIIAVFQPHRYSRTKLLGSRFPEAFKGVDVLCISPVYAASEEPETGGSSADLYVKFRDAGFSPVLAGNLTEAWNWLRWTAKSGDLVLLVGAGDIERLAVKAASYKKSPWTRRIRPLPDFGPDAEVKGDVPGGSLCTFRTGGPIRVVANVYTLNGLREVLKWASSEKFRVAPLGCGSDILVPDTGYNGVAIRFKGVFEEIIDEGGWMVTAGSGVIGGMLISHMAKSGLGGLEYMDGIPGTVGGWAAMNAGAHGYSFGQRIVRIKTLTSRGEINDIPAPDLKLDYRRNFSVAGRIILSVTVRGEPDYIAAIEKQREEYRRRRFNFSGMKTAGSVFRNPPGHFAGKILEEAGCKGMRVGGAHVSSKHANIIVAEEGASASDIIALMDIMCSRSVYPLVPEIHVLS